MVKEAPFMTEQKEKKTFKTILQKQKKLIIILAAIFAVLIAAYFIFIYFKS